MSWFIWQGRDTRSVTNLIVTAPPKVTFAGTRYDERYINGRNGSIITENGLSAYDIEVNVSLKGEPSYTEGTKTYTGFGALTKFLYGDVAERVKNKLIFSNRPNVFYTAYLLNAIDVERLLRYKTATIKFHVQPLKGKYYEAKDSYGYFYRGTKAVGKSVICASSILTDGSDLPRKCKFYIQPDFTFDTRTVVDITMYEEDAPVGYCGKHIKTNVLGIFLPSGCKPIFVFDFATEDYFVCNNSYGDLNSTSDEQIFRKYTKENALFTLNSHLQEHDDVYCDGDSFINTDVSLWHDVTFNGSGEVVTLKRYDASTSVTTGNYHAVIVPSEVIR